MSLLVFTEIGADGRYEPVESGIVVAALESLGIRSAAALSAAQIQAVGERLGVTRLLVGSVLESGTVRGGDGVPSVGMTLKLLDAGTGRVLWTRMGFRTGEDDETVFGWGRERSPQKLAAHLATELVRQLPSPADTMATKGGTR